MKLLTTAKSRRAWFALVGVIAVASLVATACGSDRDDDDAGTPTTTTAATTTAAPTTAAPTTEAPVTPTTADSGGTDGGETGGTDGDETGGTDGGTATTMAPTTTAAPPPPDPDVPMFGNKPWPCGPGDASGETWQGVDDDRIVIGVGDDRGYAASPGLNQHQTNAVISFIRMCNEMGGINGRQIEYIEYDSAIFEATARMTEACEQVFMLVGSGFSLDGFAEQVRVGCGLGAVPAWTVSVDFAHGPWQINAVPNPGDQTPMSMAVHGAQVAEDRGYDITKSGSMFGDFGATQETWYKVRDTYPDYGYEFGENLALEYSTTGEPSWTPFIQQLKGDGVEVVYFTGSCPFFFQSVREEAALNDFDAIWLTDANFYDNACSAVNESRALDNTFVRMVFIPFEEADQNKATQDFIDVLTADGNDELTLLGMQAVSSFLLWATGAAACGSDLTRDCVLDEIRKIAEWNGHGLHVTTNPAGNLAPTCGMLMEMQGTEYVRVLPEEPGTFDCDSSWASDVEIQAVIDAQLDENRIAQRYLGG